MKKHFKRKGFTLVEMVITLLVVGILILGGIKGLELYTNAKLYQLKSEFESFEEVLNNYYLKHVKMPGRLRNTQGDYYFSQTKFWQDLRSEGFVDGNAADGTPPRHAFNKADTVWLPYVTGGEYSYQIYINTLVLCATNVNAVHAQSIDIKFDDGNSKTGRIKSVKQNSGILKADGTPSNALWWYIQSNKLINYTDNPGTEWYVTICQEQGRWKR